MTQCVARKGISLEVLFLHIVMQWLYTITVQGPHPPYFRLVTALLAVGLIVLSWFLYNYASGEVS